MPDPIKYLQQFVGDWRGDVSLEMEGKTYGMHERMNIVSATAGRSISAEETAFSEELGPFSAVHIAGYDPYGNKVHWFTSDSYDITHDHVGEWKSPSHLSMENSSVRDGKKYLEKVDITFMDANNLNLEFVSTLDGKVTQKGSGQFHK